MYFNCFTLRKSEFIVLTWLLWTIEHDIIKRGNEDDCSNQAAAEKVLVKLHGIIVMPSFPLLSISIIQKESLLVWKR